MLSPSALPRDVTSWLSPSGAGCQGYWRGRCGAAQLPSAQHSLTDNGVTETICQTSSIITHTHLRINSTQQILPNLLRWKEVKFD